MSSSLARRTIPFATLTVSLLFLSACSAQHLSGGAAPQLAPTPDDASTARLSADDLTIRAGPLPRAAGDESARHLSFDPAWLSGGAGVITPLQLTIQDVFRPDMFGSVERAAPFGTLPWALDVDALSLEGGIMGLDPSTVFLAVADRLSPFELGAPVRALEACAWCSSDPLPSAQLIAAAFKPTLADEGWSRGGDTGTPRYGGDVKRDGFDSPVTATPEPATLTLAAIGIATLAGFRRRRGGRS